MVLTVEAGGTVVTVEQLHGKLRSGWREPAALYTRAWCARTPGADDRFVAVAPGEDAPIKLRAPELPLGFAGWLARAEDATRVRRRMAPAIGRLIDAARPLAVVGDDDIVVWARGLVDDEVRVRAMAELAAALAIEPLGGGLGPYR